MVKLLTLQWFGKAWQATGTHKAYVFWARWDGVHASCPHIFSINDGHHHGGPPKVHS